MLEKIRSPFFLLGNPRSGTSLLRLMLNAHPEIAVPPECGFALWLHPRYAARDPRDPAVRAAYAADVARCRKFDTWGLPAARLRAALLRRAPTDHAALAAAVHAAYAEHRGRRPRLVGDKNNWYAARARRLAAAFPRSRLVHLARDGRDVACSYLDLAERRIESAFRPRLPRRIEDIAAEWARTCAEVESLAGPRLLTVRYEDLLAAPEAELSRICAFLGVSYDPAMLEHHLGSDEPESFLQWKEKTLEPLDPGNAGRWRTRLDPGQAARFETVAGPMLERLRYVCGQAA